ncbi:MAG: type II toxin-antitoxin system prevent-host-death family antitoxin, partial [Lachnospiraceae bacterium]|nr:type II toxin-antitoxin system prevent-host-death family antitoxin [Lachnospiraceae bacterium]
MSITATELKINLGKYLMLAKTEDIYITRNGK